MKTITMKISWNIHSQIGQTSKPQVEFEPFDAQIGNATINFQNRTFEELIELINEYLEQDFLKEISKADGMWIYELSV